MSEFIGSRISLISKSDIKYVGTLHEINSENSTVALENVKSFGTEGRRGDPEHEIPPGDSVYEYIVFRGSDVKDLTIVEPPKENKAPQQPQMPNDPAILGSARPAQPPQSQPSQPQQQHQQPPGQQQFRGGPSPYPPAPYGYPPQNNARFAPPGGPHGFPGAPGAVPGYGMFGGPPPPGWYPPPGQGFPPGPPGPFSPPPGHSQPQHMQHMGGPGQQPPQQAQPPLAVTPTSSAPPLSAITSPPPQDNKPTELSATPAPSHAPENALPPKTKAKAAPEAAAPNEPTSARPDAKGSAKNSRVAIPLAARSAQSTSAKPANAGPGSTPAAASAAQQTQSSTQAAAAAVAAAMAKLGPMPGVQPSQVGGQQDVDNLAKKVGEMRTDERIKHSRQPGTGGFAAGHRGGRGGRRGGREGGPKPVEVPTSDFDFEGSNAKFNKQDLVKEANASDPTADTPTGEDGPKSPQADGAANGENGTSTHDEDVVIPTASTGKIYNKSTSFFDNISSEIKDRQAAQDEGKRLGGMEFRTEERKKNFETFGQGSVDNRGGFRGRGRGRGGFNGGGRGGGSSRGFSGGVRGSGYVPRGSSRGGAAGLAET